MSDISIRFAVESDLNSLGDLVAEFEHYFQDLGAPQYEIDRESRRRELRDILFGPDAFAKMMVAVIDGTVIGWVMFCRGYAFDIPPYRYYWVGGAYVRPEYRGAGLMIFRALRDYARSNGIPEIRWSVWGKNPRACTLYQRMGARRFSDWDEHFLYLDIK